ncbi:MAG: molybdopterin dinucleotide binding domain-containing protein, partial [Verrucomicrobiales bacterium]|nr:molybdopterin dinucleotide binding domain-containing protein [Verrucomicrobiales bacterium]
KIGGGMEQYFVQTEDMEAFYKEWYKNLPVDWETFKKRGIWQDETRAKDYELYEKKLTAAELEGSETDADGIITKDGKAIGVMQGEKAVIGFETPSRKIQVYDEIWPTAAKAVGLPMDDINSSPIAIYGTVPGHENLPEDRYIFSTFKWNVHTQGRSGHWKYNAEIIHTNPVFMHPDTGKKLGVTEGDSVRVSVFRPEGATYRSGEPGVMSSFENHVRFLNGMHPRVVMCSHHVGHWEHGAVGRSENATSAPEQGIADRIEDKDIPDKIWWAKKNGGIGGGVHINDALPINPCPLTGGQNWYDNICEVEKI